MDYKKGKERDKGRKESREGGGEERLNYLKAEYEINEHNLKGF